MFPIYFLLVHRLALKNNLKKNIVLFANKKKYSYICIMLQHFRNINTFQYYLWQLFAFIFFFPLIFFFWYIRDKAKQLNDF